MLENERSLVRLVSEDPGRVGAEAALDTEGAPNLLLLARHCPVTGHAQNADLGLVALGTARQVIDFARDILAQERRAQGTCVLLL